MIRFTRRRMITVSIVAAGAILFLLLTYVLYDNKVYMPELPVDGVTKKQAYASVAARNEGLAFLVREKGYNWYIYQGNAAQLKDELVKLFQAQGIDYADQLGSAYMFRKGQEQIIVGTKQWTGKYRIVQVPEDINL